MTYITKFRDRAEAGLLLAKKLRKYANRKEVLILALPRGGVPVGFEVANALNAPLDIFVVRKLGVPGEEELAMGAIATGCRQALQGEGQLLKHPLSGGARAHLHERINCKEGGLMNELNAKSGSKCVAEMTPHDPQRPGVRKCADEGRSAPPLYCWYVWN